MKGYINDRFSSVVKRFSDGFLGFFGEQLLRAEPVIYGHPVVDGLLGHTHMCGGVFCQTRLYGCVDDNKSLLSSSTDIQGCACVVRLISTSRYGGGHNKKNESTRHKTTLVRANWYEAAFTEFSVPTPVQEAAFNVLGVSHKM
jgi:hypothetical protein